MKDFFQNVLLPISTPIAILAVCWGITEVGNSAFGTPVGNIILLAIFVVFIVVAIIQSILEHRRDGITSVPCCMECLVPIKMHSGGSKAVGMCGNCKRSLEQKLAEK